MRVGVMGVWWLKQPLPNPSPKGGGTFRFSPPPAGEGPGVGSQSRPVYARRSDRYTACHSRRLAPRVAAGTRRVGQASLRAQTHHETQWWVCARKAGLDPPYEFRRWAAEGIDRDDAMSSFVIGIDGGASSTTALLAEVETGL